MQQNSLSITELAQKIESNMKTKKDLIVPPKSIMVRPDEIEIHNEGIYKPTEHFHRQVAAHTDIPWKYYDRMKSKPNLFNHSLAEWLGDKDTDRMVRTIQTQRIEEGNPDMVIEDTARAFLSNKYRRIENEHIAQAVLPVLMDNPHTQLLSSQVTETKMYIMVAFANREAEVKAGDIVRAGIIIQNSEIGMSRFSVLPYVHRLWCDNGAVADIGGRYGFKQVHVGRRIEGSENMVAYSDETIQSDDHTLQLKMRDTVQSISTGPMWDEIVSGMQKAAESTEIERPKKAVEEVSKVLKLNETESEGVLTNLLQGRDLTRWGLGNAVTALGNTVKDYDRATELQQIGGNVFNMPEREWNRIAKTGTDD